MNGQLDTKKRIYNLEERTAKFGEAVIILLKKFPINPVNKRLIEQAVGSAGSLGANYSEATEAESRSDFIHKIGICKKETKEVKHWIRLLACANDNFTQELRELWKEAQELLLIFSKTIKTTRNDHLKID